MKVASGVVVRAQYRAVHQTSWAYLAKVSHRLTLANLVDNLGNNSGLNHSLQ